MKSILKKKAKIMSVLIQMMEARSRPGGDRLHTIGSLLHHSVFFQPHFKH